MIFFIPLHFPAGFKTKATPFLFYSLSIIKFSSDVGCVVVFPLLYSSYRNFDLTWPNLMSRTKAGWSLIFPACSSYILTQSAMHSLLFELMNANPSRAHLYAVPLGDEPPAF